MAARITLTFAFGLADGPDYIIFEAPTRCVVGRASDCDICLPFAHADVSRYHCVFDFNPPLVWVRDLGSRNGTFVNGERLPPRAGEPWRDASGSQSSEDWVLADGDEVRLGHVVVRVGITATADESVHTPAGLLL
jgi:pSer/pThr/pTyr-binding forkhead associated (FHA) protein